MLSKYFLVVQEDNWLIHLGQQSYLQQCDGAYCCALESKGAAANKSLWFDDRLRKFAFLLWQRDVDCKTETNLRAAEEYLIANRERERKLTLGQPTH